MPRTGRGICAHELLAYRTPLSDTFYEETGVLIVLYCPAFRVPEYSEWPASSDSGAHKIQGRGGLHSEYFGQPSWLQL
jgi:hypothetical protein